jgi:hypothetical protein
MAAVFAVITAVGWFVFHSQLIWTVIASGAFLLLALAAPSLLLPLNRVWALIAGRMGRALNFVLLATFFYAIMLPAGLLMRMIGRDPAARQFDASASTYFQPVGRKSTTETLKDMF